MENHSSYTANELGDPPKKPVQQKNFMNLRLFYYIATFAMGAALVYLTLDYYKQSLACSGSAILAIGIGHLFKNRMK